MLKKLTERFYYMPMDAKTDRPILGLIVGDKYSLAIDAGTSPKHAREFLDAAKELGINNLKFLVITHWHWDHVFGINEMGLVTIAHENTPEALKKWQEMKWDTASIDMNCKEGIFTEFTANCIKTELIDEKEFSIGNIEMTYRDELKIDLGGVTCIIKAAGGNHTNDTSVIYIPEERVMFLGDCVYGGMLNKVYGYYHRDVEAMTNIINQYEATHYLVSHEELMGKEEIDEFFGLLSNSGRAVGEGCTIEEAINNYKNINGREPNEDEAGMINHFVNWAKERNNI